MEILLHLIKWIGIAIASTILLLGLYVLISLLVAKIPVSAENVSSAAIEFFIITNGTHTDLVVPIKTECIDWFEYLSYKHTKSKDSTYKFVAFGWGDKGFYLETPTWSDLKISVALKAGLGFSTAAMHTSFYHTMPVEHNCIPLQLTTDQYMRLINYIKASFKQSPQNKFLHIETKANYNNNDAFYEANGRYSIFYTCNSWANNALIVSGQKASLWTLFDKGIFNLYTGQYLPKP